MEMSNLILIGVIELIAVLIAALIYLLNQNRSLKRLIEKLKERMGELVERIRSFGGDAESEESDDDEKNYLSFIESQLALTKTHHDALNSTQDIVLDIDPETPLERRAAAVRYAFLTAEKETTASREEGDTNWALLNLKYDRLFSYYEDYASDEEEEPSDSASAEELEELRQELENAKKRISNLEKFKALYFELEERWKDSKEIAESQYTELSQMASQTDDPAAFESKLNDYHANFTEVGSIIEKGVNSDTTLVIEKTSKMDANLSEEVRHLRAVAADQHQIITGLQERLRNASTADERSEIVAGLQDELQKQMRFVQESETCIQLMEDELNTANSELEQLRAKTSSMTQLRTELKEVRDQKDEYELKLYALKTENRRMTKKLKAATSSGGGGSKASTATASPASAPSANDQGEVKKLKKELTEMEARYNDLEEKYLDLKLQQ